MTNASRVFTPAAQRAQAERGSAKAYERRLAEGFPDKVTPELAAFIAEQDTVFLATATADGAPYIQHRGGPKGFIKVIDERTLGFADYRGNRQYITLANLSENDRAYLFLLDPARKQRIKLWGRARVVENDPALIERLFDAGYKARPERAILFTIEAWDVNCSQHITARFTEAELEEAFKKVQAKIAALEAENARLRALIAQKTPSEPLAMNHDQYPDSYIRGILNTVKTIAMVGFSPKENRPSYFVFKYLLERGYRVIPVNPGYAGKEILGQRVYAKLSDIPEPVDMVDIFRASEHILPIVQEALTLEPKPRVIWMQLTIRNDEAAKLAEDAGLKVVMNRCVKIEYGRLSSEISWMGVNSRTLSSKRAQVLGKGVQRMSIGAEKTKKIDS